MEANPRVEAEKRLITKAFEDENFKKELLENPKAVLQKEFGAELPEDVKVDALEITGEKTYFVIPQTPPSDVDLPDESEANAGAEAIMLKAWKDEGFKNELLSDSKAALKKAFGIEFPETLEVVALEETPNQLYLTLPLKDPSVDELSDEDLEAVAGGECAVTTTCAVIGTAIAVGALFTAIGGATAGGAIAGYAWGRDVASGRAWG